MTSEIVTIASAGLRAQINPFGAELWRVQDAHGRDLLWDGDPAWWTGRAPLLFPIIGRLPDDRFEHKGRVYDLPKHGLARRGLFEVVARAPARATFRLAASEASRAVYPFDFVLEVEFAVDGPDLSMTATVRNAGAETMPATFGYHPAFRWPLPDGGARGGHAIHFVEPEAGPLRRLGGDGLLAADRRVSPVEGRKLALRDDLFVDDAVILQSIAGRSLRYAGEGGPALDISWRGLPHLGVWTKPGAPYVCIEPWRSLPAESQAAAALTDRRDLDQLAPGEAFEVAMSLRLG